jgi:thiol-disulfide isomerase/thioredoxin
MKTQLLLIVLSITIFFSFDLIAQANWQNDIVTIHGKIVNFNKSADCKVIQFYFKNDLTNRYVQNIYTAEIDREGGFKLTVSLHYPLDFTIIYKSRDILLCKPGDSLFIEIEDENIYVTKGTRLKENVLLKDFFQGFSSKKYYDETRDNALTHKSPNDFKAYILGRENEYRTYWRKFKKTNKTTSFFNEWVEDFLKYETLSDLMIYPSCYARENNMEEDSLALPIDYYDRIKKCNLNDCHLISSRHADFLNDYYRWVLSYPRDSVAKSKEYFHNQGIATGAGILLRMICRNSNGFAQNLALTKFYLDAIEGKQLDVFEALYDSTLITDPFFNAIIVGKHIKLKEYMANQITEGVNIQTIKSSIVKGLIDTLLTKYTGEIIYIDFWAPWCSPCMGEMPFSKKLQEKFKKKDVVFLYLANRCTESSWKATIANEELTGEQILLTDDQYAILAAEFGIIGIPHYVLIDKKGTIVSKNAPRPSQEVAISKSINDLLWNQ